jgi:CheY-like chemotaxis protein
MQGSGGTRPSVCSRRVSTPSLAVVDRPVLLVMEDANQRADFRRILAAHGCVTEGVDSVEAALITLRAAPFDAVITSLEFQTNDGVDVIEWLGRHLPSTSVFVVSDQVSDDRRTWLNERKIPVFSLSFDDEQAASLIRAVLGRRGFFGFGIEIELFDYVQMVALSGRDKLIEVEVSSDRVASVWFEHGDIVHVDFAGLSGEGAFYAMLNEDVGRFRERFFVAPPRRTVFASSMHLLMEFARRADEQSLPHVGAHSSDLDRKTALYGEGAPEEIADDPSSEALREVSLVEAVSDSMISPIVSAQESGIYERSSQSGPHGVAPWSASGSASMINPLDDPETRRLMLGQFFAYDGVKGVAILSSTGKVLAEDLRSDPSQVTLAGFLMRGAARVSRSLGQGVFDGVIADDCDGRTVLMVAMGATSAVLVLDEKADASALRREILEDQ